jgi:uncharacterized repeat protein (TIGR01451 family)
MVVGQGLTSVTWSAPGLAVRATGPATADADKPVTYRIDVSNTGDIPAPNVVLAYSLPEASAYVSSNPPAQVFGNRLEWRLGDMPARGAPQAVEVTVSMRLQARYDHRFRATSMRGAEPVPELQAEGVASTIVNRSALVIRMRAPQTVPVGGQATFLAEIENASSLPATNVLATATFDEGMQHVSGQASPIAANVTASLAPGQKQVLALNFIVRQPGQRCLRLEASADGGLRTFTEACFTATAEAPVPRASMRLTGPDRLALGEKGQYEIEVRNDGSVPLTNLRISNQLGTSYRLTGASQGYQLARGEVFWELPQLAVGDAIKWLFEVQGTRPDPSARNIATVRAEQGILQTVERLTRIEGGIVPPGVGDTRPPPEQPDVTPVRGDLKVEIRDLDDPVVVDQIVTYRIDVTNQSREADQNVGIVIEKPAEFDYVDLRGAAGVTGNVTATRIVLKTIAELRGGEPLQPIQLRLKPRKVGSYTVKTIVKSARVPEGITATQETRVVAE